MKAVTVLVLSLFLITGLVGAVGAQSDAQSDAQKAPDVKIDVKPPDVKAPDIKIEGKIETKQESPAASPRTDPGGGGRVLGMNSTVAIVAGAMLVFVVILALVAMTRRTT
jgi:hypothetical protein